MIEGRDSLAQVKTLVRGRVGVLADASQTRHWNFPWNDADRETDFRDIDWEVFRGRDHESLLTALGEKSKPRRLACLVISTGFLQSAANREWIAREEVSLAIKRANSEGMGLLVMPSRIPEEVGPFPLTFLPDDCTVSYKYRDPEVCELSKFHVDNSLSRGPLVEWGPDHGSPPVAQGKTRVLVDMVNDSLSRWRGLFASRDAKSGDVLLSRRTTGRICVSTIDIDRCAPELFVGVVKRLIRTSGLLLVVPDERFDEADEKFGLIWMQQLPAALHASVMRWASSDGARDAAIQALEDSFSHLMFFTDAASVATTYRVDALAHRLENGGSVTYVMEWTDQEVVIPIEGTPGYLNVLREAEANFLDQQTEIDSTTFNLFGFALVAAAARKTIHDQDLVPSLFSIERSQEIILDAMHNRVRGYSVGSVDDLVLPTTNLLLSVSTLRNNAIGAFSKDSESKVAAVHAWLTEKLEDRSVSEADLEQASESIGMYLRVCGPEHLPDCLAALADHERRGSGSIRVDEDPVFRILHSSGFLDPDEELEVDPRTIEDLVTVARSADEDFEARAISYLLLLEFAKHQPLGKSFVVGGSNVAGPDESHHDDSDRRMWRDQRARIFELTAERNSLRREYSLALKSSRIAWAVLAIVCGLLLAGGVLLLTLGTEWDIKHDAGLYFGSIAAVFVLSGILVRKLDRGDRARMIPAWSWKTIKILGFFREADRNSDSKDHLAGQDTAQRQETSADTSKVRQSN